jgi:hypothetical protein
MTIISLTYLEGNNYLTLRSKVKVPQRSLWYATLRLMVMHPHAKYHWTISKDKNVMAQTRKYYLIFFYLTLRSNVKVPQRSLWYATHRLMVMHPHTKYHWPFWSISKNLLLWNCLAKWTETWWEAPMEGSVLSFHKAEWKLSDTGSAHWASGLYQWSLGLACHKNILTFFFFL